MPVRLVSGITGHSWTQTAVADQERGSVVLLRRMIKDISTGDPRNWSDIWIAKDYSKRDLFEDLATLQDTIQKEAK